MKKYRAFAEDEHGKKYKGTFLAESLSEARQKLQQEGYIIVTLDELGEAPLSDPLKPQDQGPRAQPSGSGKKPELIEREKETTLFAVFFAKWAPKLKILRPYLIGAACLAAIWYLFPKLIPTLTDAPLNNAVIDFFNAEFAEDYAAQYGHFSAEFQRSFFSVDGYIRSRQAEAGYRLRHNASKENPDQNPTMAAVARLRRQAPRFRDLVKLRQRLGIAEMKALVGYGDYEETFWIKLVLEGGTWKIISYRKERRELAPGFPVPIESEGQSGPADMPEQIQINPSQVKPAGKTVKRVVVEQE